MICYQGWLHAACALGALSQVRALHPGARVTLTKGRATAWRYVAIAPILDIGYDTSKPARRNAKGSEFADIITELGYNWVTGRGVPDLRHGSLRS